MVLGGFRSFHVLVTTLKGGGRPRDPPPATALYDHYLLNVKDKDKPQDRQGAVYKIKCYDCKATYIGEMGRNLNT